MENEQVEGKEDEQSETSEAPDAITIAEKKRRARRKKGKIDEVLSSLHRIAESIGSASFQQTLTRQVTHEIRMLAEVAKSAAARLTNLDGLNKVGDYLDNLCSCSANTNWHVVASYGELFKLNASVTELNQTLKTLQMNNPVDLSRPGWAPPASAPASVFSLRSAEPYFGPPPGYPGAQPQYVGAPPPPQPQPQPPQPPPPPPPSESILSMLTDLTGSEVFKIGRDFGLFMVPGAETEFMKTNGLRQSEWIAERLSGNPAAVAVIKERVDEYRKFLTHGYKNRKLP